MVFLTTPHLALKFSDSFDLFQQMMTKNKNLRSNSVIFSFFTCFEHEIVTFLSRMRYGKFEMKIIWDSSW